MKPRPLLTVLLCTMISISPFSSIQAHAEGWTAENGQWKYYIDEQPLQDGLFVIDHHTYKFDASGCMYTGWYFDQNNKYFFHQNGILSTNEWVCIDDKWYLFQENGICCTGWTNDNGTLYYLDPKSGAMCTGWICLNDLWYYFNPKGALQTSQWIHEKSASYYVNEHGVWTQTDHFRIYDPHQAVSIYTEDLFGFLLWLSCHQNDEDARYALTILNDTSGWTQDGTNNSLSISEHLSLQYDGMTLEHLETALNWIDVSNQIRQAEGKASLLVNSTMMAIAQKCLAWSSTVIAHSGAYNIGENLSWGYTNPFDGWYTKEKELYLNGERDFHKIGHYVNLLDEYSVTGYAFSSHSVYKTAHQQSFAPGLDTSLMNRNAVTTTVYREKLEQYKQFLNSSLSS